jgi:hypothetical protein
MTTRISDKTRRSEKRVLTATIPVNSRADPPRRVQTVGAPVSDAVGALVSDAIDEGQRCSRRRARWGYSELPGVLWYQA